MKVIPKKTFLLKQVEGKDGKLKDVVAHAGIAIEVSDKEAKQFAGYFMPVKEKAAAKIEDEQVEEEEVKKPVAKKK